MLPLREIERTVRNAALIKKKNQIFLIYKSEWSSCKLIHIW
jgi:hypothetical protein